MGTCCLQVSFLNASNCTELSAMMLIEKDNIQLIIQKAVPGQEESTSFLMQACDHIDILAELIKDSDLEPKLHEINVLVNNFFLALDKMDKTKYYHDKNNIEVFISSNNVLVL